MREVRFCTPHSSAISRCMGNKMSQLTTFVSVVHTKTHTRHQEGRCSTFVFDRQSHKALGLGSWCSSGSNCATDFENDSAVLQVLPWRLDLRCERHGIRGMIGDRYVVQEDVLKEHSILQPGGKCSMAITIHLLTLIIRTNLNLKQVGGR